MSELLLGPWPLLSAGFVLGLIHAFDADHVMAVSTLSSDQNARQKWNAIKMCAHWALGHGAVLIALALLLYGFNTPLPESLQQAAEMLVGCVLIAIGVFCIWQIRTQNIHLVKHTHGDIVHTHWRIARSGHSDEDSPAASPARSRRSFALHRSTLLGVLHGVAGSAPAFALIPAVSQGQFTLAVIYLCVFSVGVLLSMLSLGAGLGFFQSRLSDRYLRIQKYCLGGLSVILGGFWLSQTWLLA